METIVADELARSHAYGGRSVFGWEPAPSSGSGERAAPALRQGTRRV